MPAMPQFRVQDAPPALIEQPMLVPEVNVDIDPATGNRVVKFTACLASGFRLKQYVFVMDEASAAGLGRALLAPSVTVATEVPPNGAGA